MKKTFTLCALFALILTACNNNAPAPTQTVTFTVATFEQTTAPLKAPAAVILDDENGSPLTDIFVYDGENEVAHQTSDMDVFGTVTLPMTYGEHTLHFVATKSKGLSFGNSILSMTSVGSTFGKHLTIDVTSTTENQDLILDQLTARLIISISDAFPSDADSIEFVMDKRCMALRIDDFFGCQEEVNNFKASCKSKAGQSGVQYIINNLVKLLDTEYKTNLTINVYNAQKTVIATVTVPNVRLAANTKTILSGNLFTMPAATISVNTEWKQDIVMGF